MRLQWAEILRSSRLPVNTFFANLLKKHHLFLASADPAVRQPSGRPRKSRV